MAVKKRRLILWMVFIVAVVLVSVSGCANKSTPKSAPESTPAAWVTMNLERKGNKGQLSPEKVHKVLIFRFDDYYSGSQNITPVSEIRDEAGLKLFANMVNNARPIDGILDVAAPPYIAEVYCQNRVAVLSLNIGYPQKGERYGGMYINECNTEQGYHITVEDAKAFWDAYGRSLS